jgi:putative PIN family toxin of toxin-antitoxin system
VASWGLADEIARVLRRPKLRAYRISEEDVAAVLGLPTVEAPISSRDPKDSVVIEAALSGEAQTIVTGDADLLDDDELRRRLAEHGIRVVTPAELVEMLGK